jgi:pimeloyl-ACP methyl ester carboxylesterase
MHSETIHIDVGEQHLAGTLAMPETGVPGILFLHGWTGSQERDMIRAQQIAALGCVCLTFDFRGHAATSNLLGKVTREDNLRDALAAYDRLIATSMVDPKAIAVVGSSYGAYLAAVLSGLRPVRWLSLRVPALYRDTDWEVPKGSLDRADLNAYRGAFVPAQDNRALRACAAFNGDALIVESEHALSDERSRESYTSLLVGWIREMVLGAR